MTELLVSLAIIAALFIVFGVLRAFVPVVAQTRMAKDLIVDSIVSMEFCAVAFEMGVVMEVAGVTGWVVCLFFVVIVQNFRWSSCIMPAPQVHIVDALSGKRPVSEAALRIAVLLASGLITFRLMAVVWSLELSAFHVGRPAALTECSTPWGHVPTHWSVLAEFVGSFVLGIAPRLWLESPRARQMHPVPMVMVVSALVVCTILPAASVSGGMYNPMLASVLFGGCNGHSMAQHVLIYWLGATAGAVAAHCAFPSIREAVLGAKEKKKAF